MVYAHPAGHSFCAAARDRALATLHDHGHDVDLLDLHAEGFEPCAHEDPAALVRRLQRAAAVVFVYPTWWSGPPAILQGWLDGVWAAGDGPTFRHVRRIVVLTTHGSSKRVNLLEGGVGKHLLGRTLRWRCGWRCRFDWIALYGIDTSTAEARRSYLDRMARRLARAFP